MEHGTIVEYIDQQQIFCAVVLEYNDQRVRLLNEDNREVNQKINRLFARASSVNLDRKQVLLNAFFALARVAS